MKYIMTFTVGIILAFGSSAYADMKCVVPGSAGNPDISMEFDADGLLTISIYGHSRNTFKASYEHNPLTYAAYAKVDDQSTWKNMPDHLLISWYVRKDEPGQFFKVSGLPSLSYLEVSEFYNCVKN